MFGLGNLIGGAMKIGGSIFGGIKASQAMKDVEKSYGEQLMDAIREHDRKANQDFTQRADAQQVWTHTLDYIKDRNKQAAGTQAVMGGTEESVAATKAANAQSLADTASQIAAAGANLKDKYDSDLYNRKAEINNGLRALKLGKVNNIISAVNGVSTAASDIAADSGLDDIQLWKRKNENEG